MYNVNDAVVYASYGVCTVKSIENRDFSGESVEYYVLQPVNDIRNTFYVPTKVGTLHEKIRKVCSREEAEKLISGMNEENNIWIDDEPLRKAEYRRILDRGDKHELISLIKTLSNRSRELDRKKKKLHSADERILHDAENVLYDEFAYALEIPKDQVAPYIREHE